MGHPHGTCILGRSAMFFIHTGVLFGLGNYMVSDVIVVWRTVIASQDFVSIACFLTKYTSAVVSLSVAGLFLIPCASLQRLGNLRGNENGSVL